MGRELDRRRPCDRQPGVEDGGRECVDRAQQGEGVDRLDGSRNQPRISGCPDGDCGEGGVVGMQAQINLAHERGRERTGRLHADAVLG